MDISQVYSSLQHARTASSAGAAARTAASSAPGGAASTVRSAVTVKAAATAKASASNSANITSNDFLTLLVTEMKNQDPTATTDPNAYINQLVGVNSLQQLIQINTDLGGNGTAPAPATGQASNGIANALSKSSTASLPEASGNNNWTPKAANASDWEAAAAKKSAAFTPLSH